MGTVVPDSTFIRWHLEKRHDIDFDPGLTDEEKGIAWAFEKMCEDHLYWVMVWERWLIDENFEKGPRTFFDIIPALLRPLVVPKIRRDVKRDLRGQGLGRHSHQELTQLAIRDLDALSSFLGDKPYLMGDQPCGADAAVHSALTSVMTEFFQTPVQKAANDQANLVAYRDRGLAEWFPDFKA